MAKKTAKVLKGLKKDVAKLQERYDKLAGTLEKTREDQAAAYRNFVTSSKSGWLEETPSLSSRGTTRATTRDLRSRKRRRGGPRNWA